MIYADFSMEILLFCVLKQKRDCQSYWWGALFFNGLLSSMNLMVSDHKVCATMSEKGIAVARYKNDV